MTPTFLRAAQARVQVLDMRAAIQGLPLFNRYVHTICEIVMELATRWTQALATASWRLDVYTPRRR